MRNKFLSRFVMFPSISNWIEVSSEGHKSRQKSKVARDSVPLQEQFIVCLRHSGYNPVDNQRQNLRRSISNGRLRSEVISRIGPWNRSRIMDGARGGRVDGKCAIFNVKCSNKVVRSQTGVVWCHVRLHDFRFGVSMTYCVGLSRRWMGIWRSVALGRIRSQNGEGIVSMLPDSHEGACAREAAALPLDSCRNLTMNEKRFCQCI